MKVGSTAGMISGLLPGAEKAGEDLQTTYVPNGTTDIIIIVLKVCNRRKQQIINSITFIGG
jgi:hypothetical protein